MSQWPWAVALLLVSACVGSDDASGASDVTVELPPEAMISDRDGDGLCDATEDALGTDPGAADSDDDGLSDLEEFNNGFDPTNTEQPAGDQVVHLAAQRGAVTNFAVRATVEGNGGSVSGAFEWLPALDPDGLSAVDFFVAGSAASAEPVDAVRSIDSPSARFGGVLGKTRLGFNLRFEYPIARLDPRDVTCARSYLFRYAIKADDGTSRAAGLYLLRLMPADTSEAAACLPVVCQ